MSVLFPSIDLNRPLSLYSIPVIWFTGFYPSTQKFFRIYNSVGFNNVAPRSNAPKNLKGRLSTDTIEQLHRMDSAHRNGCENMPLWFAAIVRVTQIVGNIAGLDNRWLNTMALMYVATRILYNTVYIYFNWIGRGWFRSAVFTFGFINPLIILINAAAAVANRE